MKPKTNEQSTSAPEGSYNAIQEQAAQDKRRGRPSTTKNEQAK